MKAKVIATGEIIEVNDGSIVQVQCADWGKDYQLYELQLLPDDTEQLRQKAAVAAMQGIIGLFENPNVLISYNRKSGEEKKQISDIVGEQAVDYAQGLVTAYKAVLEDEAKERQRKLEQEQQQKQEQQRKCEVQIGEKRELNGKTYLCALAGKSDDCDSCALFAKDKDCLKPDSWGNCSSDYRTDGNDVYFKETE